MRFVDGHSACVEIVTLFLETEPYQTADLWQDETSYFPGDSIHHKQIELPLEDHFHGVRCVVLKTDYSGSSLPC